MSTELDPEVGRERGEIEVVVVVATGAGANEGARSPSGTWSEFVSISSGFAVAIVAGVEINSEIEAIEAGDVKNSEIMAYQSRS